MSIETRPILTLPSWSVQLTDVTTKVFQLLWDRPLLSHCLHRQTTDHCSLKIMSYHTSQLCLFRETLYLHLIMVQCKVHHFLQSGQLLSSRQLKENAHPPFQAELARRRPQVQKLLLATFVEVSFALCNGSQIG
jgi:hypothetical protein